LCDLCIYSLISLLHFFAFVSLYHFLDFFAYLFSPQAAEHLPSLSKISTTGFNISDAVKWSNDNATTGNTLCAEFVADCLNAGGLRIDKTFTTYDYGCSGYTVIRCATLFYYLRDILGCEVVYNPSASDVKVGDVIMYDGHNSFNMTKATTIERGNYDTIGHAAFVVDFRGSTPLINQHNGNWKQQDWDFIPNMGDRLLIKTSALG